MSISKSLKNSLYVICIISLAIYLLARDNRIPNWKLLYTGTQAAENQPSRIEYTKGFIADNIPTPGVHAPALVELSDGTVLSVWYGGKREGAGDVALYSSMLFPKPLRGPLLSKHWVAIVWRLSLVRTSGNLVMQFCLQVKT